MMYWIFKHYMKRLVADYHEAYQTHFDLTHDETMRPDVYQLEKYLNGEYRK